MEKYSKILNFIETVMVIETSILLLLTLFFFIFSVKVKWEMLFAYFASSVITFFVSLKNAYKIP